ncbi:MAG: acyltransferase family protein [Mucilaginibacter sp.]|uniref:acyltransferase family protein n=1 Tax=Mucilaginibacter sp. TaxID=1882438 RepID=UPI0034E6111C
MTETLTQKTAKPRLLSLDVFRGITVAFMTLVNNPGDWGHIYAPLEHSEWNGCTPTDLVFPFFLFIVGVSIVYALESKKTDIGLHKKLTIGVLRRAVILYLIGLVLNLFPYLHFSTVRIPGVIQRIAVVYAIAALFYIYGNRKVWTNAFVAILVAYFLIMTFIPVPGVGYANLNPETNLGAWLDRTILGEAHLWKSSKTWDPEGILSTIPAVATALFGILAGTFLKRKDKDDAQKVSWLFAVGVLSVIAGLVVDLFFPINKALWTSSFVLYTGGLATIGLTLLYWLIDVQGYKRFTKPFVVFGVNAITVYTLSGLIPRILSMINVHNAEGKTVNGHQYLYEKFFTPYFSPINASLAGGLTYVLIWFVILWLMYRKNIIIKV